MVQKCNKEINEICKKGNLAHFWAIFGPIIQPKAIFKKKVTKELSWQLACYLGVIYGKFPNNLVKILKKKCNFGLIWAVPGAPGNPDL